MSGDLPDWLDQYSRSDDPIEGFPYGGWRSPESVCSTLQDPEPYDDHLSLVQWDWIARHCPGKHGGFGVHWQVQEVIRVSPVEGWKGAKVVFHYLWFADAGIARRYAERFGL